MSELRAGQIVSGVVIEHRPFGVFVDISEEELGVALITMLEDEPRSPDPMLPAVGARIAGVFLGYSRPGRQPRFDRSIRRPPELARDPDGVQMRDHTGAPNPIPWP